MSRTAVKESPTGSTKVEVTDFGPIHNGSVEIMPMTILTGPNNSGKSYAVLLIRSMFGYMHRLRLSAYSKRSKRASATPEPIVEGVPMSDDAYRNMVGNFFDKFQERFLHDVEKTFSADLDSLIRIGAKKCTIRTQTRRMTMTMDVSNRHIKCRLLRAEKPDIRLNVDQNKDWGYSVSRDSVTIDMPESNQAFLQEMMFRYLHRYFQSDKVFYLPAARSGILQGHTAISASIIRNAQYVGLKEIEIPKLPGVVADFIIDIIEMSTRQGPFYDIATDLEKEILQGQVEIERGRTTSNIQYVYKQRRIPIHLASSTVSEIAPLILYLKHTVSQKSTLIIEEPEAHLHPHNQAILAKYLVRLVRKGLKIVLTTHSPFILEQISNLIQAGNIVGTHQTNVENSTDSRTPDGMDEDVNSALLDYLGFEKDDYLKADEVAAYEFRNSREGYNIHRLKVKKDEGIPAKEFVRASDKLYREYIAMQDGVVDGR